MQSKRGAIIGAVVTLGLFVLTNAKRAADALAIIHLPHDLGEFLTAMSRVPELLSYGALATGIICVAYLIAGSWEAAPTVDAGVITPREIQGVSAPPSFDWKSVADAVEAFAESSLIAERDKQRERMEKAILRRLDAEFKIKAILNKLPDQKAAEGTDEFKQIEQQRQLIRANATIESMTEPSLRSAWDKLREDIHAKLATGRLIAKGFREPHVTGSVEVEISAAEWRLFTLDNVESTALRNGDIAYSGLVIRSA